MNWFLTLLSGQPHFYIGGRDNPYMLRWYLLPRNRWLNLYLHKFCRDDDDRALHDHPWWFVSVMLWGSYVETVPSSPWNRNARCVGGDWLLDRYRGWLSVAYRRATDRHRVSLDNGHCWTLVLTGPKVREWGFWCPKGFVVWTDFVDQTDSGNIGKGCG